MSFCMRLRNEKEGFVFSFNYLSAMMRRLQHLPINKIVLFVPLFSVRTFFFLEAQTH